MRDLVGRLIFTACFAVTIGVILDLSGCIRKPGCIPVDWQTLGTGKCIIYDIPNNSCKLEEVLRQNFKLIETRLNKCPCADPGIMFGRNPEDFEGGAE